ncbi:ulp1 protease family, C-terminal catalytic domain-containing protein [Artemisia annua]|uniref:Ulp1 protease family, C-terminal catalytic domain-containing protein n=1 Tax=Artemisia annua TaxID=35608 RepID=A0A2U1KN72_ARTAN|nr:ulp1 protease family, C-terminal catalytic domain-containing protein [Artemisia annua]
MKCEWFIRSMEYIRGLQMQMIEMVDEQIANTIPLSQMGPEDMDAEENANQVPVGEMDDAANANEPPVDAANGNAEKDAENANEPPVGEIENDIPVVDTVDEYMADDVVGVEDDKDETSNGQDANGIEVGKNATLDDIPDNKDEMSNSQCPEKDPEPSDKDAAIMNEAVAEPQTYDRSVKDPKPSDKDAALPTSIYNKDHILYEVASIKSKVGNIENSVGVVDVSHLLRQVSILKERIGVVENVLGVKFEENLVANDDKLVVDDGHINIWILETFPNSSQFFSKDPSKIPRALSWSKIKSFDKKHHFILFDQRVQPIKKLIPTHSEMKCEWFIRSMEYIRGLQMQLIEMVDEQIANTIPLSQMCPEDMDAEENANQVPVGEMDDVANVNAEKDGENANEPPVDGANVNAEKDGENANEPPVDGANANAEKDGENANDPPVDGANANAEKEGENANEPPVAEIENDIPFLDMVDEYMADDFVGVEDDKDERSNEQDDNGIAVGKNATLDDIPDNTDEMCNMQCPVVMNEPVAEPQTSDKDAALPIYNKDHILSEVASIKSKVGNIEKSVGVVDVSHLLRQVSILKERIGVVENVLGVKFEEKLVGNGDKLVVDDGHINLKTADANTPMTTNAADDEKHKLHYMDPSMFTGPMTQLMKAVFISSPDPDQARNVMQVDVDCTSLPNLNEKFSDIGYDGFDQTPHDVRIHLQESMNVDTEVKESEIVADKETKCEEQPDTVVADTPCEKLGNTSEQPDSSEKQTCDTEEQPDTVVADTPCEELGDTSEHPDSAGKQTCDTADQPDLVMADTPSEKVVEQSAEGNDIAREPEGKRAITDDNGIEYICIDDEDDPEAVKAEKVRSIFTSLKRKRKVGKYYKSPYTNPPDTTPIKLRRRSSRINHENMSPPKAPDFDDNLEVSQLEPFIENLSRARRSKPFKVTVPAYFKKWLNEAPPKAQFFFPWGDENNVVDRRFWECLLGTGAWSAGWLRDEHLDVWVDLMWVHRPSDADWAMAGGFFSACVMDGNLRGYWANGVKYPVSWCDVEKVLFPINEPRKHWALGELHIRTGVVTIYDSFRRHSYKHTWWNKTMPEVFGYRLPKYLKEHGVLSAKGIETDGYAITWKYADNVPQQCTDYGDCGIWVCINLYRLCHNMSLNAEDPAKTAIAYRERMVDYLWKQKIEI